jgi:hypothetical protein
VAALISVSATLGDRSYSAEFSVLGGTPIVVEQGIDVEVGQDGNLILRIDRRAVRSIGLKHKGAKTHLEVAGDFGTIEASVNF